MGAPKFSPEEIEEAVRRHHPEYWLASYHHVTSKDKYIDFDSPGYKFQEAIYLDDSPDMVIKKCTQVGISEYLIVRAMAKMYRGRNVFYVVPKYDLLKRFVRLRLDKSISKTPIYSQGLQLIHEMGGKATDNISTKTLWGSSIVFVGSNSKSGFSEFVADDSIVDEYDHCFQDFLPMVKDRQGDSENPTALKSGNPTFPNYGITKEYELSDQKRWHVRCSCKNWINPDFYKHLVKDVGDEDYAVIDSEWEPGKEPRYICDKCGKPFDPKGEGEWVATYPSIDVSGYQIGSEFASKRKASDLLKVFEKSLENESERQDFENNWLGREYISQGSGILEKNLDDCIGDYRMPESTTNVCVMGIDVGEVLHVTINDISDPNRPRKVFIGTIRFNGYGDEIDEIDELCARYNVKAGVIDAMPETRLSRRICSRFRFFFRWFHSEGIRDRLDTVERIVKTDRNLMLDDLKESIIIKKLALPKNCRTLKPLTSKGISEYYDNLTAPIRTFNEKGDKGRGRYEWIHTRPDHYAFAEGYADIARKIIISL